MGRWPWRLQRGVDHQRARGRQPGRREARAFSAGGAGGARPSQCLDLGPRRQPRGEGLSGAVRQAAHLETAALGRRPSTRRPSGGLTEGPEVQVVAPRDLHRVLGGVTGARVSPDSSGPAAAGRSAGVACGWVEKPAQVPSSGPEPHQPLNEALRGSGAALRWRGLAWRGEEVPQRRDLVAEPWT